MLSDQVVSEICAAVDSGFARQVEFTQAMVTIPSLRGQEAPAQDLMADAMRERGLDLDKWKLDINELKGLPGFSPVAVSYDQAINVVGTYRPTRESGRSLIFNGHVDVVPTGLPDRWRFGPFEPKIEGKWLYGRGSGDMKSGLAATLFAFDAVRNSGYSPKGRIHFQSVVEEESTGNGTLACLQRGYRADAAFIPEPSGELFTRGEVGLIWARITVKGDPEHASGFIGVGTNAIEKAMALWPYIKALEARWNERKSEIPLYRDHPFPVRVNIGEIHGGEWTSSVPATAALNVRVGLMPGFTQEEVRREIEDAVRYASRHDTYLSNNPPVVDYFGHMSAGYFVKHADAPEDILRRAHAKITGTNMREVVTSASSDARYFNLYQDTWGVNYGPTVEKAHGFDERVDLESVKRVTKTMALFLAEWCGLSDDRSQA
ncbi:MULTISPECIES: ArgE/DapE family deacylase [Mesorhizobium]|uniref:ArgE/DapE family deacylase n=1 Tax=Mesorhizobium TaxID=68287 RepID=UPI001FDEF2BC|nr:MULTISPECIES: ArgE/DapE family deacylase [Mesorhizobium]